MGWAILRDGRKESGEAPDEAIVDYGYCVFAMRLEDFVTVPKLTALGLFRSGYDSRTLPGIGMLIGMGRERTVGV